MNFFTCTSKFEKNFHIYNTNSSLSWWAVISSTKFSIWHLKCISVFWTHTEPNTCTIISITWHLYIHVGKDELTPLIGFECLQYTVTNVGIIITHAKFSYLLGTWHINIHVQCMYLMYIQSITLITVLFLSQQLFLQNF